MNEIKRVQRLEKILNLLYPLTHDCGLADEAYNLVDMAVTQSNNAITWQDVSDSLPKHIDYAMSKKGYVRELTTEGNAIRWTKKPDCQKCGDTKSVTAYFCEYEGKVAYITHDGAYPTYDLNAMLRHLEKGVTE